MKKIIAYSFITCLLFGLFITTVSGNVFIPQAYNNPANTSPAGDKVVVTNLPLYTGAPTYSFMGKNGLVWWVYVGFAAQECVPPDGVPGNVFWQRVMLTNAEGNSCFDVTNLVLGSYANECSSDKRPSAFAYNDSNASLTFYGPGDYRVCHLPLSLVGPIGQNKAVASITEEQLRPMTTNIHEVDWPWPEEIKPSHYIMQDGDTFEVMP